MLRYHGGRTGNGPIGVEAKERTSNRLRRPKYLGGTPTVRYVPRRERRLSNRRKTTKEKVTKGNTCDF